MAPTAAESLSSIVNQIKTTTNLTTLSNALRNNLPKDTRETILASPMESGADPLLALEIRPHTLGIIYILSARLNVSVPGSLAFPSMDYIAQFSRLFNPEQARLAPERVSLLARGIQRLASHLRSYNLAVEPLGNLVMRFPHSPSNLTPIHSIFTTQCLLTKSYTAALPLILHYPLENVSMQECPDLVYTDNLSYQYAAGMILGALGMWTEAADWFSGVVAAPSAQGSERGALSALQVEAGKKLWLIQLISKGKIEPLPKYTHPHLLRILKSTPYHAFANAYPQNTALLRNIVEKEQIFFEQEKNLGLVKKALGRAPGWVMKKLTGTYLTLPLTGIGKAIGIADEEEVRALVLRMIELDEISAQMFTTPGPSGTTTVTFSDPTPSFTAEEVDRVLLQLQNHASILSDLDGQIGRSTNFLSKVVKSQGSRDTEWAGGYDEEMSMLGNTVWSEDYN